MAWHAVAQPGLLLLLYALVFMEAMAKNIGESKKYFFLHPQTPSLFSTDSKTISRNNHYNRWLGMHV